MKKGENYVDNIPWFNYSALEFLENWMSLYAPLQRVFEWGCGGSTGYWAKYAGEVIAVEHEKKWADKIRDKPKTKVIVCPLGPHYPKQIDHKGLFDIVSIDGRMRVECLVNGAWKHVRPGGLLILDNSERVRYRPGLKAVPVKGWTRNRFWAKGRLDAYWETCIWERDK